MSVTKHEKSRQGRAAFLVAPPGLEPGKTVPKTGVLPLHHGAFALRRSEDKQGEVTFVYYGGTEFCGWRVPKNRAGS